MKCESYYPFFRFLAYYYNGDVCKADFTAFQSLTEALEKEKASENETVSAALTSLHNVAEDEYESFKFSFNKLFVGPGKLKAPPYESSYRNKQGLIMQDETMAVRRAYLAQGLKLKKQNIEPDDHIALEMEFLAEMIRRNEEEAFSRFLLEHAAVWAAPHCKCIKDNTTDRICLGMADLLAAVISCAKNELLGDDQRC